MHCLTRVGCRRRPASYTTRYFPQMFVLSIHAVALGCWSQLFTEDRCFCETTYCRILLYLFISLKAHCQAKRPAYSARKWNYIVDVSAKINFCLWWSVLRSETTDRLPSNDTSNETSCPLKSFIVESKTHRVEINAKILGRFFEEKPKRGDTDYHWS